MKDKDLYKLLLKDGWELKRIRGSHHTICKGDKTETIPIHNKDLPPGLLKAIIKNTGIKL